MAYQKTPRDTQPGEEWRYIPGTEQMYSISSFGRVYNEKYSRFLKPTVTTSGYYRVDIRVTQAKTQMIHRLVALAFIGLPLGRRELEINHKDGNKANNRLDNLEVVTHSQNMRHAIENNLWKYQKARKPNGIGPIAKRIRFLATEVLGIYPYDIIAMTGAHHSIINGKMKNIKQKTIDKITSVFPVNPDWIKNGTMPIMLKEYDCKD